MTKYTDHIVGRIWACVKTQKYKIDAQNSLVWTRLKARYKVL